MDALLGSKKLPPGFRFHPTDEELFMFYLKRKVLGKSLGPKVMSEVDVNQFAPWELPAKACLKARDLNWYFMCPRAKKYPNGGRANRATVYGYWKSTGNDRTVQYKNCPVGKIKTLIFHRGKAPKGDRTDWVMHEYRLDDRLLAEQGVPQDSYVICKIYEKSGLGPKNGEHYGAPFVEEEWDIDSDDDENLELDSGFVSHPEKCGTIDARPVSEATTVDTGNLSPVEQPVSVGFAPCQNGSFIGTSWEGQNSVAAASIPSAVEQRSALASLPPIEAEEDDLERMLATFIEDDGPQADEINIISGLGELAGGSSSGADIDWSQILSSGFLEMDDLQD